MSSRLGSHVWAEQPGWAAEYEAMLEAYREAGGDPEVLSMPRVAALVVSANRVLASSEVPGVRFEAQERPNGIVARIVVDPGTKPERPVHLCFGMLPAEGVQEIESHFEIGAGADVRFLTHCTFPRATRLRHVMDATFDVGEGASMAYEEAHFHGPHGGVEVVPRARVTVEEGGRFLSTFSLVHGRVGRLDVGYDVSVGPGGLVELTTKAFGRAADHIGVDEVLHLDGEGARGMTKTRIAVRDDAVSEVSTTAEGNAPLARGHMDCAEIVRDRAVASNTPHVVVRDDRAHVTHEAAIGTVNRKELQTLMARGLDEDEAVDVIVRGMLR
jgi:Fe-S cluster assembly scaffold protein SufB